MSAEQAHPALKNGHCTEQGCERADIELVARSDRHVVALCPAHRKEYLGVSS